MPTTDLLKVGLIQYKHNQSHQYPRYSPEQEAYPLEIDKGKNKEKMAKISLKLLLEKLRAWLIEGRIGVN